ncbi:hypothetical protein SK128_004523, partial [Halocaridina rubra]
MCTYNVTRRHLLSQHMRVHGIDPGPDEGLELCESTPDERSNSPSPSLTITPVNNVAAALIVGGGCTSQDSTFTDASVLPKLTEQATLPLDDIPLVWVSRDNRFFKMFKCRHCPHVNLRVMSAHLKVHGGSMGQCHAIVDPALSDEEQLRILTSKSNSSPETFVKNEASVLKDDEKIMYFCQQCPARFFFEKEIHIHSRFHSSILPHHCCHCDFGAREQVHLLAHAKVHSPEYQSRTQEQVPLSGVDLLRKKREMEKEGQYRSEPETSSNEKSCAKSKHTIKEKEDAIDADNDPMRVGDRNLHYPLHIDKVTGKSREKRYKCSRCPSAFEKTEQYNVHVNLHGSSHKYKCRICDYSVKFFANFMMHVNRHKYHEKMVAQKAGKTLPPDNDEKYEPIIHNCDSSSDSKESKNKNDDKENIDDRDLTTTERQHLLLQNKK